MSFLSRYLLIFGFAFLTGCETIYVTQPLSDPQTSEPDERLYGHWVASLTPDGKKMNLHVYVGKHMSKSNPKSIMEAGIVNWEPTEKKIRTKQVYFTLTKIDEVTYINIIDSYDKNTEEMLITDNYEKWFNNPTKYSILMRYRMEGSKLQLWFAAKSLRTLEELGAQGKVKLAKRKKNETPTDSGLVTADSLVSYLRKNGGDALFDSDVLSFTKVP